MFRNSPLFSGGRYGYTQRANYTVSGRNGVAFGVDYLSRLMNGEKISEADYARYRDLSYSKTMHCGMLDSVESLCETALEKTLNYLLDGLMPTHSY